MYIHTYKYTFPIGKAGDINSIRYDILKYVTNNIGANDKIIEENREMVNEYLISWGLPIIKGNCSLSETIIYIHTYTYTQYIHTYIQIIQQNVISINHL